MKIYPVRAENKQIGGKNAEVSGRACSPKQLSDSDRWVVIQSVPVDIFFFMLFACQQLDYQSFLSRVSGIHDADVCNVAYPSNSQKGRFSRHEPQTFS
ncbi:hypothetical protein ACHBE6_000093 [Klebsiella aerogenes]